MSGKVAVAGAVTAGFPSPAEQYMEPPLDLNDLLVKRPAATYFVKVEGDSMIGRGLHPDDLLVVDRSLPPENDDVIIACVNGDFTVKTYRRDAKGIHLVPANPNYPTLTFSRDALDDEDNFVAVRELEYFGKVTACIHRFVKDRKDRGTKKPS